MDAGLIGGLIGVSLMVGLPVVYYSCRVCYRKLKERRKAPILPLYSDVKAVPVTVHPKRAPQTSMRSFFSLNH